MTRAFIGAALAVALLGSVSAYAAEATTGGSSTMPAATDTPATPPASLHCKAPKVPTQVTSKAGKVSWKCQKPAAAPAATPQ